MTLTLRYTIYPTSTAYAVWDAQAMWWATGPMSKTACHDWIDRATAGKDAAS